MEAVHNTSRFNSPDQVTGAAFTFTTIITTTIITG